MLGVVAALATAFLWALTALLIKVEAGRLSPLAINAYRVTAASAIFLVLYGLTGDMGRLLAVPADAALALLASVLCAMVGGATLNAVAILKIGLARAFPISGAYPLGTLVLSALLLDEGLGWVEGLAALLTLAGVILVAMPAGATRVAPLDRRTNLVGVATAVGAAFFWAAASIITKFAIVGVDLLTATTLRLPPAALALWALLLWREGWPLKQPPWRLSALSAASVVAAGVLGPGVSSYLWMTGIREIGVARTDVLAATAPLFALLMAVVVLRERPGWRALVGGPLSVLGIMLVVWRMAGA